MMRILLTILFFLFACSQEGAEHVGGVAEEDCCEPLKGGVDPAALSDESLFLLDHAFEDQHAESRRLVDLAGKPVVLAMIFTHCEYACPAILQDLHKLEEAMSEAERDATQWVLVSFDVERDVPEVLAAYAEREELDPAEAPSLPLPPPLGGELASGSAHVPPWSPPFAAAARSWPAPSAPG